MKNSILIIMIISVNLLSAPKDPLVITYIANEGFLLNNSTQKILIDAAFNDSTITYCDVPAPQVIQNMKTGHPPFDNLDVIFATHSHRDHFDAELTGNILKANKQCKLVCPAQAAEKMRELEAFPEIVAQIVEITPELFAKVDTTINNIPITISRVHHGPYYDINPQTGKKINRHRNVENLCFVVTLHNKRILHVGDAPLYMNNQIFSTLEPVDIIFMERYDRSENAVSILNTYLKPKEIIFMHLPKQDRESLITEILDQFSNGHIFTTSMQKQIFN